MSPIERKWWFMLPVMVLSGIATQFLLTSAELPHAPSFAGSLIFGLCIVTVPRPVVLHLDGTAVGRTRAGGRKTRQAPSRQQLV